MPREVSEEALTLYDDIYMDAYKMYISKHPNDSRESAHEFALKVMELETQKSMMTRIQYEVSNVRASLNQIGSRIR